MRAAILCVVLLVAAAAIADSNVVDADAVARDVEEMFKNRRSLRTLSDYEVVMRGGRTRATFLGRTRSLSDGLYDQPFPDQLRIDLEAYDTVIHFDLEINDYLLGGNMAINIHRDGVRTDISNQLKHRYYRGTAQSDLGEGWARVSVHRAQDDDVVIEGAFMMGDQMYTISTVEKFDRIMAQVNENAAGARRRRSADSEPVMIIYRNEQLREVTPGAERCGLDNEHFETQKGLLDHVIASTSASSSASYFHAEEEGHVRGKRVEPGCPPGIKVIYMGFAADCTYFQQYGATAASVTEQILNNVNLASAVFERTFNYAIGVVEITIRATCGGLGTSANWNQRCQDLTITNRLSRFSCWRGGNCDSDKPTNGSDAGLWHLMSACPTGSTVGIAWLNMLCQTAAFDQTSGGVTQWVSGTGVTTASASEWLVMAHEIGHNLGAKHDCTLDDCPCTSCTCCKCTDLAGACNCGARFIMNPTSDVSTENFSPCSQKDICTRTSMSGVCLGEPGSRVVLNTGVCGNGIWEPPEQCDCGGEAGCLNNTCCFSNCTLKAGAQCNDGNTACCKDCHVSSDTSLVCRPANGECDVAEHCDGVNALCPVDKFVADGTECTSAGAEGTTCATGVCTSRTLQCKTVVDIEGNQVYTNDCPQFRGTCRLSCIGTLDTTCSFLSGNFRNGTPCGDGGFCNGNVCSNPDVVGTVIQWIEANLALVITLAVIVGLLLLGLLIWGCRKANRKQVKNTGQPSRMNRLVRSFTQRGMSREQRAAMQQQQQAAANGNGAPPGQPPASGRPPANGGRPNNAASPSPRSSYDRPPGRSTPPVAGVTSVPPPAPFNPDYIPAADAPPPSYTPPQPGASVPMQIRCPICHGYYPNEAALNRHLDIDHQ